jgi:hypothetical protein
MDFLLIILFMIIIGLIVWYIVSNSSFNPLPKDACTEYYPPLVLPLYRDANKVYKTKLVLGILNNNSFQTTTIEAVPDTGSSMLLVNSSTCQGCDLSDGSWNPQWGKKVSWFPRTIKYSGGQSSTFNLWKGYLIYDNEKNIFREITFGLVESMKSQYYNPENVLGLQSGGFLASLCNSDTFLFDYPNQRLIIGESSEYLKGKNLLISFQSNRSKYGVKFIEISVNNINNLSNLTKYRFVIDTGMTETVIPPSLYSKVKGNDITIDNKITFPISSVRQGKIIDDRTIFIGNSWLEKYLILFEPDKISLYL